MKLKGYKYRIYPTLEQRIYFAKTFGSVRFVYNRMLDDRIKDYENYKVTGEKTKMPTPAKYKQEFEWLKEVDSLALANAQLNLNTAYNNFFKRPEVGYPSFQSKSNRQSFKTNNQGNTIRCTNNYLKIPKLKTMIKVNIHRPFDGLIKSATISKTPSGKYFVSLLVECESVPLPRVEKKIGLDVGLKEFAIGSDGMRVANPKHLRKSEAKLKKLQRSVSRKKKGSSNRNKARIQLSKQHERIANQRKDFLHKLSTKVIYENQVIAIEDLKVKNLLKNHKLAKAISEASWSEFRTMLEYKAKWYGRKIVVAPSNYPSSRLCSCCKEKYDNDVQPEGKWSLAIREWTCVHCLTTHDRDQNAAYNLLALAN
jgi:putative transposase